MALQFSPYPLEPWLLKQRSEQRPDFNQTVTQPLLQGIQTYQQGLELKRQRELQDLQKQKLLQDMENERLANEPLPPFVIQEPFNPQLPLNREGQPGDFYSQFNQYKQQELMAPKNYEGGMQWLSKLKPQQQMRGLNILKTLGEYEKNIREKPEPMYVIPKVDNEGNVVGYEPIPAGMKPTTFAKPVNSIIDKNKAKLEAEKPKAMGSLRDTLREYDNMINEATAIKNDPSLPYATGLASPFANIPGTGSKRVGARLETLKSKTLLNVLSSLKSLSNNGASGFGNLSIPEGEAIKTSISTLDKSQGTSDFKNSLDRFIMEMQARKESLKRTFQDKYGDEYVDKGIADQPSSGQNKIRVRRISDGVTGSINANDYDPNKYERL